MELKTINLPHLPKKYKSIRKWWNGGYTIHTEAETNGALKLSKGCWESAIVRKGVRHAKEYVDISILEKAFVDTDQDIVLINHKEEKDMPVARVGSVFVLRNDPKRYYALTIKAGIVSVRNLNGVSEWSKTFVPEDNSKITFGELESILPQNIGMNDLVILPEPEEIIELLKQ